MSAGKLLATKSVKERTDIVIHLAPNQPKIINNITNQLYFTFTLNISHQSIFQQLSD